MKNVCTHIPGVGLSVALSFFQSFRSGAFHCEIWERREHLSGVCDHHLVAGIKNNMRGLTEMGH